jgi:hypothetical protein
LSYFTCSSQLRVTLDPILRFNRLLTRFRWTGNQWKSGLQWRSHATAAWWSTLRSAAFRFTRSPTFSHTSLWNWRTLLAIRRFRSSSWRWITIFLMCMLWLIVHFFIFHFAICY